MEQKAKAAFFFFLHHLESVACLYVYTQELFLSHVLMYGTLL